MSIIGVCSTMLDQGTVILSPADWPQGVRIVLVTSDSGELCGELSEPARQPTHFNITVGPNRSRADTIRATVIVTVFYLLVGLVGVSLSIIVFNLKFDVSHCNDEIKKKIKEELAEHHEKIERKNPDQSLVEDDNLQYDDSRSRVKDFFLNRIKGSKVKFLANVKERKSEQSLVVEIDGRKRLKSRKCVADLCNELKDITKSKAVYKKSHLYIGALLLMSIFYSLPTIQMVLRFSQQEEISGNHDICYYNELCRRSLGSLSDFNHIFSNIGYCVFGLLFMMIVKIREQKYERFEEKINEEMKRSNIEVECSSLGVPRQYGLYYAMGLALTMEGVMSACYHVCPTKITFQFDTTFMYVIAIIMFMKLYQVINMPMQNRGEFFLLF